MSDSVPKPKFGVDLYWVLFYWLLHPWCMFVQNKYSASLCTGVGIGYYYQQDPGVRRLGTHYRTVSIIHRSAAAALGVVWKLYFSRNTSVLSAIEMLHDIALYKFNIHIHLLVGWQGWRILRPLYREKQVCHHDRRHHHHCLPQPPNGHCLSSHPNRYSARIASNWHCFALVNIFALCTDSVDCYLGVIEMWPKVCLQS